MFKTAKRWLLCLLVIPMVACAQSEEPYKEGVHYVELADAVETSDPSKIEVVEMFWYGCPHCYSLEARVERWKKQMPADVEFVRKPVVWRGAEPHARAYYAAQVLGILEQSHPALFEEWHKHGRPLKTQEALAGFYTQFGVTEEAFNKAYKSFPVSGQVSRVKKAQREYRVSGVPLVVVNGKYKVTGTMEAGTSGLFDVVDYLVQKERTAN